MRHGSKRTLAALVAARQSPEPWNRVEGLTSQVIMLKNAFGNIGENTLLHRVYSEYIPASSRGTRMALEAL